MDELQSVRREFPECRQKVSSVLSIPGYSSMSRCKYKVKVASYRASAEVANGTLTFTAGTASVRVSLRELTQERGRDCPASGVARVCIDDVVSVRSFAAPQQQLSSAVFRWLPTSEPKANADCGQSGCYEDERGLYRVDLSHVTWV